MWTRKIVHNKVSNTITPRLLAHLVTIMCNTFPSIDYDVKWRPDCLYALQIACDTSLTLPELKRLRQVVSEAVAQRDSAHAWSARQLPVETVLHHLESRKHERHDVKLGYTDFFPVTYSCIPFAAGDPMFHHILSKCLLIGTERGVSSPSDSMSPAATATGDVILTSLSFTSLAYVERGLLINVCYSGVNAGECVLSHVLRILESLPESALRDQREIFLCINLPKDVDKSPLTAVLSPSFSTDVRWDRLYIFDSKLHSNDLTRSKI